MTLNLGVIGTGLIGQDHIRRISTVLSGARVAAVTDVDTGRAQDVAGKLRDVRVHQTGQDLIADEDVDAVVVTSWGGTHEEYVLAAIGAGKQVFCEKPLATTREACDRIIDAELAAGRRLVMVGFMRRFDRGYQAMKATLGEAGIGTPLLFHSAHCNPAVPPSITTDGVIVDTCVHDFDIARWLLDTEVAAIQAFAPRRSSHAANDLQDPLMLVLEMASSALTDVVTAVNIGYGYDIRGEIVGETGTVELAESDDAELQQWIDAVSAGTSTGPSSWDGYAATVVCDAGMQAFHSGQRVEVAMREQPALYDATTG